MENKDQKVDASPKDTSHPEAATQTYYSDVKETFSSNDPAAMSKILRGEREREAAEKLKKKVRNKNTLGIIVSFIIVVIGILLFVLILGRNRTVAPTTNRAQASIVPAQIHTGIDTTHSTQFKVRSTIREALQQNVSLGEVHNIYFTKSGNLIESEELASQFDFELSPAFVRTLRPAFMYGVLGHDENLPFLILTVEDFDQAFTGMRSWEEDLLSNIALLFDIDLGALSDRAFVQPFSAAVIGNKNARTLYGTTRITSNITKNKVEEITEEILVTDARGRQTTEVITWPERIWHELFIPYAPNWHYQEAQDGRVRITTDTPVGDEEFLEINLRQVPQCTDIETPPDPQATNRCLVVQGTSLLMYSPVEKDDEGNALSRDFQKLTTAIEARNTLVNEAVVTEGEEFLVLYYTFLSEGTILLATDPVVIPEITDRIANRQIIR